MTRSRRSSEPVYGNSLQKPSFTLRQNSFAAFETSLASAAWLGWRRRFRGHWRRVVGMYSPCVLSISLAKGKPFWTQAEYTRLLDLTSVLYAGKFAYPDYLFLTRPMGSTREREFIAAFNEEDALSPGSYPDLFAAPEIVHEVISPVMVVEAIEGVIESFDSRMRDIRSDLEKLDFDKATDSQVIGLRNKLLGLSRDIAVVCGDATVLVDMGLIWPDYPLFISVDPSQRPLPLPDGESAVDVTRRNLRSLIKNIQAQETGLRELTLITSQSISDANDTKLQASVLTLTDKLSRLTVWLVVLTGVVVFFTLALVGIGLYQIFSPPSGTGSPSPTPSVSTPATQAPPRPTPKYKCLGKAQIVAGSPTELVLHNVKRRPVNAGIRRRGLCRGL